MGRFENAFKVVLVGLVGYGLYYVLPVLELNAVWLVGLVLLALGSLVRLDEMYSKNNSGRLITFNINYSLGRGPIPFTYQGEQHNLFRLGGFVSNILPAQWGDQGALIVSERLTENFGGNYVARGVPRYVDRNNLPSFVRSYLEENQIDPPYYKVDIPTEADLEELAEQNDMDIDLVDADDVQAHIESLASSVDSLTEQTKRQKDMLRSGLDAGEIVMDKFSKAYRSHGGRRGYLGKVKDSLGLSDDGGNE